VENSVLKHWLELLDILAEEIADRADFDRI
jgi:hypothetical protein